MESRLGTATSDEPGLTGGMGRGDPVGEDWVATVRGEGCGAVRGELILAMEGRAGVCGALQGRVGSSREGEIQTTGKLTIY